MNTLYTAEALSTGQGREGRVFTSDGTLDVAMTPPKELGGSGNGTNPEQLVARTQKVKVENSTVGGRVHFGQLETGGYQLAVELEVIIPDMPHEQAQALADAAHQVCPYSNATRGNIEVTVLVSDD